MRKNSLLAASVIALGAAFGPLAPAMAQPVGANMSLTTTSQSNNPAIWPTPPRGAAVPIDPSVIGQFGPSDSSSLYPAATPDLQVAATAQARTGAIWPTSPRGAAVPIDSSVIGQFGPSESSSLYPVTTPDMQVASAAQANNGAIWPTPPRGAAMPIDSSVIGQFGPSESSSLYPVTTHQERVASATQAGKKLGGNAYIAKHGGAIKTAHAGIWTPPGV